MPGPLPQSVSDNVSANIDSLSLVTSVTTATPLSAGSQLVNSSSTSSLPAGAMLSGGSTAAASTDLISLATTTTAAAITTTPSSSSAANPGNVCT